MKNNLRILITVCKLILQNIVHQISIQYLCSVLVFGVAEQLNIILDICLCRKLAVIHIQQISIRFLEQRCRITMWIFTSCTNIILAKHCLDNRKLLCVHICASAAVGNIICACDEVENFLHGFHTLIHILFSREAFNKRFQLASFVKRHRIVQGVNVADTAHVRQILDIVGNFNINLVNRVEKVRGHPKLTRIANRSVSVCKGCRIADCGFCTCFSVHVFVSKID